MKTHRICTLFLAAALCACAAPSKREQLVLSVPESPRGGKVPTDGDYWALRYTYPTMEFDSRWLEEAKLQHDRMPEGMPAGTSRLTNAHGPGEQLEGIQTNLSPVEFTALGPKPLDGSFSHAAGRVNVIVSHPSNPAIAYLGSDGGGIWKTTNCCDANTTWTSLNDDPLFNSIAIGDLHLDPNNPDIVYGGTGDLRYGSYSFGSSGLLRSSDAGATWEILGAEVFNPYYAQPPGVFPQYQAIGKVRVDPNDSNTIVVGTKTGIFISYNDGADWTGPCLTNAFTTQRQDITALELFDHGEFTGILTGVGTRGAPTAVQPNLSENGANGVYKGTLPVSGCPTDWGHVSTTNWPTGTGGGVPYPNNTVGRIELAVAPSNPDIIYAEAVHADTLFVLGVWKSEDGGDTWTQQATLGDLGGCAGGGGQAWYDAGITVDPNDPDVVFLSDIDVYRSDNAADTFTNITCGYSGGMPSGDDVHVDQHARAFVNGESNRLLIGNDGGVYYTANADAANPRDMVFTHMNTTLNTIEFYSGDITGSFNTAETPGAVGGAQDNGSSVAVWNGAPSEMIWTEVFGGDGIYARIEPINEQRWYVESQRGNLGISQSGPFGPYFGVAEPWSGERRGFLFPFEIQKHDCPETGCEHLIAGSYRVWETINGGASGSDWYANSPDLTKGVLADRSIINQLAIAISDDSIAIIGTNDGNVQYGFELGQGTANSATWVDVTDGNAVLPNRPILDVFTDPEVATTGYAAVGGFDENTPMTPGHVFRVVCNADCSSFEWQNKSGDLPNIPVDSIAVNPRNPKQVFAGTDWGLYFTDDVDAENPSWVRFTAGLPSAMIWDMAIDRGFTTLALFTRARGAFAWPLPAAPLNFSSSFE
jgi:hypothetical protein